MIKKLHVILTIFGAATVLAGAAYAQSPAASPASSGPPNALQGFSKNKDEPVQIEAATLDVRDKEKIAIFTGNVHVIQGDTDLRTKKLIVYYEESDGKKGAPKTAQPGPGGESQIKKLEAIGDVFVTQKDQTAQGDKGVFDMKTNLITLTGLPGKLVVVSQGKSVLQGERLVVNRETGMSRMEGGRVSGIFDTKSKEEGLPGGKPSRTPGTN